MSVKSVVISLMLMTTLTTTMINLLIGPPGGGKSYEAVVYHVLPALAKGRKVITNLPLDLERIGAIDSAYLSLIDIRTKTKAVEPVKDWQKAESMFKKFGIAAKAEFFVNRPFAHPEDYGDPWRHPDPDNGCGPLYVIDECHMALPSRGTKIAVEEWFALHRHESADVLLITQSYGKVSRSIIDLVQVCYRVKKATAFGSAKSYIRKVQDGVRGDVVNTSIRRYEKRYFGLYKSHTRGGGSELSAEDITPIWKRWPVIGAAIMLPLSVVIFFAGGSPNILKPKTAVASPSATNAKTEPSPPAPTPNVEPAPAAQAAPPAESIAHPYSGRTLHILGTMERKGVRRYVFAVAQNGQKVSDVTSAELEQLGYKVRPGTDCAAQVSYEKWSNWIICDAPQVGIVGAGSDVSASSRKG